MKYNVDVLNTALDRALVKLQDRLVVASHKRYTDHEKYLRRSVKYAVEQLQRAEQDLTAHLSEQPKADDFRRTDAYKTIRRWQKTLALTDEAVVSLPNTADTRELLSLLTGEG